MAIDGTYGFVYSGATGIGIGAFKIDGEALIGSDSSGGRYSGRVVESPDTHQIEMQIRIEVPSDATLVNGGGPSSEPQVEELTHEFPPLFGNGDPQAIELSAGNITVMIKAIPEGFAPAAEIGFKLQIIDPASESLSTNPEATISPEAAREIGRFVIVWGSLEHELEAAITILLHMFPLLRPCLTSNLAFYAKTQVVEQAIALLSGHLIDESTVKEVHKLIKEARDYNESYRNFIFHWIVIQNSDGKSVLAARLKGGKSPHSVMLQVNANYFSDITSKVSNLRDRLRTANELLQRSTQPLRSWNVRHIPTADLEMELRRRQPPSNADLSPSAGSEINDAGA